MSNQKQYTETQIAQMACLAHEANRLLCEAQGDSSQVPYSMAPAWQRDSAVQGVRTALAGASPQQQHESWCADKTAQGWVYGQVKDPDAKTHPCLVPYGDLPAGQRAKDTLYGEVIRAFAAALSESGL